MIDDALEGSKARSLCLFRPWLVAAILLLVAASIGVGSAIALLRAEVRRYQAEVYRLREQTQQLVIADPSKCYLREVDQGLKHVWRRRVWIPDGSRFVLWSKAGQIPLEALPPKKGCTRLGEKEHGEYLATFQLIKQNRRGVDEVRVFYCFERIEDWAGNGSGDGRRRQPRFGGFTCYPETDAIIHSESGMDGYQVEDVPVVSKASEPSDRITLFRLRRREVVKTGAQSWQSNLITEPCFGFIFWLEPLSTPQSRE